MFKVGDIVKYSEKFSNPGEEYYIHEVMEVNPDTGRCLVSTLNSSISLGSSSRVDEEMIRPAEKYEIIVSRNADGEQKFFITDTETKKVFAGYDFMGSIDWTDGTAEAYQMDIEEAKQILKDINSAEEEPKMTYTITKNEAFNSIEISFTQKPSEAVREALKSLKFRWHSVKKVWYGYKTEEETKQAIENAEKPLVIPKSKAVDPGTLYEGWEGGNHKKWNTDKELKAFLLADFKKAGIKATIRFNRAGYLTSITATMEVKESEIKSFEEWRENYSITMGASWIEWTDSNGNRQQMFVEKYEALPAEEREKIDPEIYRTHYEWQKSNLSSGGFYSGGIEILNETANKRFDTLLKIVNSYNRDCSNSMVDYFDRSIYDRYHFKVVAA